MLNSHQMVLWIHRRNPKNTFRCFGNTSRQFESFVHIQSKYTAMSKTLTDVRVSHATTSFLSKVGHMVSFQPCKDTRLSMISPLVFSILPGCTFSGKSVLMLTAKDAQRKKIPQFLFGWLVSPQIVQSKIIIPIYEHNLSFSFLIHTQTKTQITLTQFFS